MKCKSTLIFFLLFLTALLCLAGDCDEQSSDGGDDDESPADDDDNNDDDNDEMPELLNLPEYRNDGRLYGVACGVDNLILTETGWEPVEIPFNYFNYCQTVDSQASVFGYDDDSGQDSVLLLTENGWQDLLYPLNFNDTLRPFIFFDRETGFAGRYLYQSGKWRRLWGRYLTDAAAPDDVVFIKDNCIYHWNGSEDTLVACLADIPFEPLPDDMDSMELSKLKYFSQTDLWAACDDDGYTPLYFAHWNGAEWDSVYFAQAGWDDLSLDWDFVSSRKGWAVAETVAYPPYHGSIRFYELTDLSWREIEKQQPPDSQTKYLHRDQGDIDPCGAVSVVSDTEVWFICSRSFSIGHGYDSQAYFYQLLDGESYFWNITEGDLYDLDMLVLQ